MSSTIQLTGTAMAVLIGAVLIIAPWPLSTSFGYKLLSTLVGGVLVWLGLSFSNG
jgi:hypothetical protein